MAILLVLGGPALLLGTWGAPRLDYDDQAMIVENPLCKEGFTLHALEQIARPPLGAFRGFYRQYTPLAHLSIGVQWALHGANWDAFRVVNLLFHLGSALLLFQILKILLSRNSSSPLEPDAEGTHARLASTSALCAALGTAFFFFHPTNVESVAWAAERNNVQALFFSLLAWRLLLPSASASFSEIPFPAP